MIAPRIILFLLLIMILLLTGCENNTSGIEQNNSDITITVGGKLDDEEVLLTKIYVLLLRHAGFTVIEKARTGKNDDVFHALMSGKIDLYPEFTTGALNRLKLQTTHNPHQDYENLKQGYEHNYHITWLDLAPLNDTYGICTLKTIASARSIVTISQLADYAQELTIALPPDANVDQNALPRVQAVYDLHFGNTITLSDEGSTFQSIIDGKAQYNMCYTTEPLISTDNFLLLRDDKNAIPPYYLAPIVRDDLLQKAPAIRPILNKVAPRLTNDVSIMLQRQLNAGFSVTDVASNWLKSQGLL